MTGVEVIKRNGYRAHYDGEKIYRAVKAAMRNAGESNNEIARDVEGAVELYLKTNAILEIEVDELSGFVEDALYDCGYSKTGRLYSKFKEQRNNERKFKKKYALLSDKFLSKYKHTENPMTALGELVYYRTYSRYLPNLDRREYWWETVARAVDYNCSLQPSTTKKEAEALYDNVFNLRQFLSGRTFWVGGTEVAKQYPMANFNCAFTIVDSFSAFKDLFYLLMVGSGVGVRILKEDVKRLPSIRSGIEVIYKDYAAIARPLRMDDTSLVFKGKNTAKIIVGDSKEGWVQSLDFYLKLLYSNDYRNINTVVIDFDNVRPKGEKLRTFGGTASGHGSLKNMFTKITKVINKRSAQATNNFAKLQPIDCLDIANIIGENVVVGGVRRTAEIALLDSDDEESIQAKSNLYKQIDGKWIVDKEVDHRQMSNNSIYYKEKPSRERLHWQIGQMRHSGEPAWVNEIAGAKRRDNMQGTNPCGEILLDSKGLCNLTTINTSHFAQSGVLDRKGLLDAQRMSVRAGYRMTGVELELPEWNHVQQRDKLLGCSLTGWQDMVNELHFSVEDQSELLRELRSVARKTADEYAEEIGDKAPILVTTVKPEGSLSQLPTVSSGVHYSHSPYYIRRVRINATDPLASVCQELGYPMFPEVGQEWETCSTKVIEFPVKAPNGRTKYDVSAIEQLENYKMFMENYVDHNCSITVHVREHEWELVEEWIWKNWDDVVAVSFLSLEDSFYDLLPYESIDSKEYSRRIAKMKTFNPELLKKYEVNKDFDVVDTECASGACPIR